MNIALTEEESVPVYDHLNRTAEISQQINKLQALVARERRDLQVAWSNAYRRHLLEQGEGDKCVPEFISPDGIVNLSIDAGRNVSWIRDREPKRTVPE